MALSWLHFLAFPRGCPTVRSVKRQGFPVMSRFFGQGLLPGAAIVLTV